MFQSFWCCRPTNGATETETVIAAHSVTAANLRNAVDISFDDFKGRDAETRSDRSASSISTCVGLESDDFCGQGQRMQLLGLAGHRHLRSTNFASGDSTGKTEDSFDESFGFFSSGRYESKTDERDESKDSSYQRHLPQSGDDSAFSRRARARRPTTGSGSNGGQGSRGNYSIASPPESLAAEDDSDMRMRLSQTSSTAKQAAARAKAARFKDSDEEPAGREEQEQRQGVGARPSSGASWRLVVEKREGQFQKVGLTTATLPDELGLEVKEIHEGGLIDEWNMKNPTMLLLPGDVITRVNGTSGDADTLRAVIALDTKLKITVSRSAVVSSGR